MKPEVFLKAAKMVRDYPHFFDSMCCCPAISYSVPASPGKGSEYHEFFAELFRPKGRGDGQRWWRGHEREPRVIALLLAYEIAKERCGES